MSEEFKAKVIKNCNGCAQAENTTGIVLPSVILVMRYSGVWLG